MSSVQCDEVARCPVDSGDRPVRPFDPRHHRRILAHIHVMTGKFRALAALYSHRPQDVANAIISYLNDPPESSVQYREGLMAAYQALRSDADPDPESPELLNQYAKIFDGLFFFGSVWGFCSFEVVSELPDGIQGVGLATSPRPYKGCIVETERECTIMLLNRSLGPFEIKDPYERLRKYLAVLLHEMIHAMFNLYVCFSCDECVKETWALEGMTGHGEAWQEVALLIEERCEELLDEDLDLRRCSSAEVEMRNGGLLSGEQLQRWDMEEQIEGDVEYWEMVNGETVLNEGGFLVAGACDAEERGMSTRYNSATESFEDLAEDHSAVRNSFESQSIHETVGEDLYDP